MSEFTTWLQLKASKITIVLLTILLIASIAGNAYFIINGGIKITKITNSTSNSTSNSYANSGSVVLNMLGMQSGFYGKWEIKEKEFKDTKELGDILRSLTPAQFAMCQVCEANKIVYYPDIVQVSDKKEGTPVTKTSTKVENK